LGKVLYLLLSSLLPPHSSSCTLWSRLYFVLAADERSSCDSTEEIAHDDWDEIPGFSSDSGRPLTPGPLGPGPSWVRPVLRSEVLSKSVVQLHNVLVDNLSRRLSFSDLGALSWGGVISHILFLPALPFPLPALPFLIFLRSVVGAGSPPPPAPPCSSISSASSQDSGARTDASAWSTWGESGACC
jgi:hypothetical protein